MELFIEDQPFLAWTDNTRVPPRVHLFVSVDVIPSDPAAEPTRPQPQRWFLDTCFSGEAYAYGYHLDNAAVAPLPPAWKVMSRLTSSVSSDDPKLLPVQPADLWLVSNRAGADKKLRLFYLALNQGITRDDRTLTSCDEIHHRALIGVPALVRAGVRVEIDFRRKVVSVWVPPEGKFCEQALQAEAL